MGEAAGAAIGRSLMNCGWDYEVVAGAVDHSNFDMMTCLEEGHLVDSCLEGGHLADS